MQSPSQAQCWGIELVLSCGLLLIDDWKVFVNKCQLVLSGFYEQFLMQSLPHSTGDIVIPGNSLTESLHLFSPNLIHCMQCLGKYTSKYSEVTNFVEVKQVYLPTPTHTHMHNLAFKFNVLWTSGKGVEASKETHRTGEQKWVQRIVTDVLSPKDDWPADC